jgi:hypothetical protein
MTADKFVEEQLNKMEFVPIDIKYASDTVESKKVALSHYLDKCQPSGVFFQIVILYCMSTYYKGRKGGKTWDFKDMIFSEVMKYSDLVEYTSEVMLWAGLYRYKDSLKNENVDKREGI